MTIDMPREEHIDGLRALWKEAFGDSDAFLDGFFATGFAPFRCRVLDWNGRSAAALYWFDCHRSGKKLAYIYAVATLEDFRGKGFCRQLMEATHRDLQALGYAGAILVPGSRGLFSLYEKLGYRAFCPMQERRVAAAGAPLPLKAVSPEDFSRLRAVLLPEGGVEQTGIEYLATFTRLYTAEDCLFSVTQEGCTAVFRNFWEILRRSPGSSALWGRRKGCFAAMGPVVPGQCIAVWKKIGTSPATLAFASVKMLTSGVKTPMSFKLVYHCEAAQQPWRSQGSIRLRICTGDSHAASRLGMTSVS